MIITSEFFSFHVWEWFLHSSVLEWTEFDLSKINCLRGVIQLILIALVPWDRFSLCHTPMLIMGCVTTWSRGSYYKERKRGWSTQKWKNLNETFLFGKLANFTNIVELSEIPKGRKQVSEPENTQFYLTLTRTQSHFFKIGLWHCRFVQVNLEPKNLRSSKQYQITQVLRSFCHPDWCGPAQKHQ
jgi:hypothetical protein